MRRRRRTSLRGVWRPDSARPTAARRPAPPAPTAIALDKSVLDAKKRDRIEGHTRINKGNLIESAFPLRRSKKLHTSSQYHSALAQCFTPLKTSTNSSSHQHSYSCVCLLLPSLSPVPLTPL
jgi:hypothetical protein